MNRMDTGNKDKTRFVENLLFFFFEKFEMDKLILNGRRLIWILKFFESQSESMDPMKGFNL